MAILQDILYKVNIRSVAGKAVTEVTDLQIDSRKVSAGSCFIAIKGSIAAAAAPIEFVRVDVARGLKLKNPFELAKTFV